MQNERNTLEQVNSPNNGQAILHFSMPNVSYETDGAAGCIQSAFLRRLGPKKRREKVHLYNTEQTCQQSNNFRPGEFHSIRLAIFTELHRVLTLGEPRRGTHRYSAPRRPWDGHHWARGRRRYDWRAQSARGNGSFSVPCRWRHGPKISTKRIPVSQMMTHVLQQPS